MKLSSFRRQVINSHSIYWLFNIGISFNCLTTRMLLIWWRRQMETFSALLVLCAAISPVTGAFPSQRPVTRSFDVFFDLRLNKQFSKQSWRRWFETQSCSLWRHCNTSWEWIPISCGGSMLRNNRKCQYILTIPRAHIAYQWLMSEGTMGEIM